jgi:threonine/homoserine/homoserine lactone efflux protein
MALITRQVVTRGRRAAQVTVLGNLSGLVVHAAALAAGLSALLVASATAYGAVKLAGAAYLVLLGLQSLREARRTRAAPREAVPQLAARRGSPYRQGLISTVLNPKPALFFLSYLPQFVDRNGPVTLQVSLLAAIHILVGLVWLSFYAWFVSRLHAALTRPRVRAALDRASGVVLIAPALLAVLLLRRPRRRATAEPPPELPVDDAPRPRRPRDAVLIGLAAGVVLGFVFAIRAGVVIAPAVALILWRGWSPRTLIAAAGALLVVVVPVLYVLFPGDDRGGYDTDYAVEHLGAHWVAVAAVVLLAVALARTLSTATRRSEGAGPTPP